jgi:hypothetical protein
VDPWIFRLYWKQAMISKGKPAPASGANPRPVKGSLAQRFHARDLQADEDAKDNRLADARLKNAKWVNLEGVLKTYGRR